MELGKLFCMPSRRAHLRRLRHWIANRGLRGVVREFVYRLQLRFQGEPQPGSTEADRGPHPFDTAYNVDTTGLVWGEDLGDAQNSQDSRYWTTGYYGIAPSAFTSALETLSVHWPRFTFIDIGCGKGRAMLLARRFPFRTLLGIELSPELVGVAQQNLLTFSAPWQHSETPGQAVIADATTFPVPSGPLVFFLYHPFAAPVMKRFLAHVQAALQLEKREVFLLYANPELDPLLMTCPGICRLWKEPFALSEEDAQADRFGSHAEYFAAYQLTADA